MMPLSVRDAGLAIFMVVVWALNFIAIRVGLDELPPIFFGGFRFLVAAIPFVFFLKLPKVKPRYLWGYGLALGIEFAILFSAMKMGMPAGLTSLVLQSQAFFTLVMGLFWFGTQPSLKRWVGLGIAFLGLAMVPRSLGMLSSLVPFLLVLAAAFFWALANIAMVKASPKDYVSFIAWTSLVPVLPLFALSCLVEGPAVIQASLQNLSLKGWGSVLYIAWLSTIVGFAIWGHLMRKYSAQAVAPFSLLVPPIALVFCHHLLGESLTGRQLVGAGLILFGLAFPFLKFFKWRGHAKTAALSGRCVHAGEVRR